MNPAAAALKAAYPYERATLVVRGDGATLSGVATARVVSGRVLIFPNNRPWR